MTINGNGETASNTRALTLRDHVCKMRPEFAKALPGHITADKFIRTAQTAVALTRNIDKVKNPQSLLAACTRAAADGLILDGREAALRVDSNGDVQYMPMFRGLMKLAYNTGEIKSLVIETVQIGDSFNYSPTRDDSPIVHEINLLKPRGEIYAVYALARLKDGGIITEVMTVPDVNRIRDRSDGFKAFKAGRIRSTPWDSDWGEMARKTVFRRLTKHLPSSTERAERLADAADLPDDEYTIEANPSAEATAPAAQTRKQRGAAAAVLKDITPVAPAAQEHPADPPHDPETGVIFEPGQDGDGLDLPDFLDRRGQRHEGDDI
jgi:recombination protein RecT